MSDDLGLSPAPQPAPPPTETFATPDDLGELRSSEVHTGLGEQLATEASQAFMGGVRQAYKIGEYNTANEPFIGDADEWRMRGPLHGLGVLPQRPPEVAIADAQRQVKDAGVGEVMKLPDQPSIRQGVLDLMIRDAHEKQQYDAVMARGPQGFLPSALGFVTSVGVGLIDPINDAAFMVPVLGEANEARILMAAGDRVIARAGANFVIGSSRGAAGTALLEPGDWWLHTKDGQDYTYADALKNIGQGAFMGGVFHTGIGGYHDVRASLRGQALPGSPRDLLERGLMQGTHVPAEALGEEGVPADELVPGTAAPRVADADRAAPHPDFDTRGGDDDYLAMGGAPGDIFADLPPGVRGDLVHAAAADVIADRPVRAGDMLAIAAQQDPRIAESVGIDAYHGSPHDFERFDITKVNTGEGAQSYGHGAYFAQEEAVARQYSKTTSYRDFVRKVRELYDEHFSPDEAHAALTESKDFTPGQKRLLAALAKDDFLGFDYPHQAVAAAVKEPGAYDLSPETHRALLEVGNLYRVRIKADQEHFLDWDKPVAEQSDHVKGALAKVFGPMHPGQRGAAVEDMLGMHARSGKEAYQALVREQTSHPGGSAGGNLSDIGRYRPERASRVLREAGVRGIEYFDRGSRVIDADPARLREEAEKLRAIVASRETRVADMPGSKYAHDDLAEARAKLAEVEHFIEHGVPQTRNFVVFDDKDIEITHKNGEPVQREEAQQLPSAKVLPGPPAARGPQRINWDRTTVGQGQAIAGSDRVVIDVPTAALDKAFRSSHRAFHVATPSDAVMGHVRSGAPMSVPEVRISRQGRLDFVDGRNRAAASRDLGEPTIPVAMERGQAERVQQLLREHAEAPAPAAAATVLPGPPAARGPRARDPATFSLFEHLAQHGGLRPDPELAAIFGGKNPFVPGFGPLIRKTGMSLDHARESAVGAGYLADPANQHGGVTESTINHLLEALDGESRGNRLYRAGAERERPHDRDEELHHINREIDGVFAENGLDHQSLPDSLRTRMVEMMDREGVRDPLEAYERAIMEEDRRGSEQGQHPPAREFIPGWDVPDDAGAAPREGGRAAPGQPGAGDAARPAGGHDGTVDLDAWRRLTEPRRDPDADADVAASKAADAAPEPASTEGPKKAISAAEAEAAKALALLEDLKPQLSADEYARFQEALDRVSDDRDAQQTIVREGFACLVAAAV